MEHIECSYPKCGNSVFSRGICRKHYEQERLATAALCTVEGCQSKVYRGNECTKHYRERLKASAEPCIVHGCNEPQLTAKSGLCKRHYYRYTTHGTLEQPRNKDWGARETHPLYGTYHWHRRTKGGMCDEWRDNFWAFVEVVGDRPEGHTLRRYSASRPLGPDNWYWKESTPSKDPSVWQKEWRKNNPDKVKNVDLRRRFGITLGTYKSMSQAQNGVCAICQQPELAVDAKGAERLMAVDHCHKTGKIRALLCSACNKALGGFKDDPELLRKAAQYIESHRT